MASLITFYLMTTFVAFTEAAAASTDPAFGQLDRRRFRQLPAPSGADDEASSAMTFSADLALLD